MGAVPPFPSHLPHLAVRGDGGVDKRRSLTARVLPRGDTAGAARGRRRGWRHLRARAAPHRPR